MKTGMFEKMQQQVARVPRGKVVTYGEIARAAGFPRAARQAAWALHGSHGLPWHRVLGAGGRILLRGEAALEQRFRLQAEGVAFDGARVRMKEHEYRFPASGKSKRKTKQKS